MSRPKMNKMYCGDGFPNHPDWSDLGGGSTYTAGDGIDITSGTISADPDGTTIGINATSKKLECLISPGPTYTAGDGIDLVDGAIGANVDGLTIGINEDGEIENLSLYTAGDGIDITEGVVSADVDGTTIGINSTTKKLECLVSGGGGVDYSTTETDTGLKWIDNSPVYQKVVSLGAFTSSDKRTPHGITNLGYLISVDSVMNIAEAEKIPIPQVTFMTNNPKITIIVDDTNIITHASSNYSTVECYAILRYTKVTTP